MTFFVVILSFESNTLKKDGGNINLCAMGVLP
jgi:hypothetical protein